MKEKKKTYRRVFVGLSGGVDSAVSAALLQKAGYEVTGVFIKAWTPEGYPCTWKEDRRSAMRVAAVLNIPFLTLDLEKEYKKEVVDYMIAEYKIGRTPNPDVMCNKEIKFGHFLKFALDNGADFVATGHYCQNSPQNQLPAKIGATKEDGIILLEGKDKNKDQSYFLWTLTQNQLEHILFPVGNLQKPEVRKLAEKFNLPQATRKDSQGLCFLGKVDMKEFLSRYIPQKRGDVLDLKEKIIGYHNGALFFTIGERHGFTITEKTERENPMYVVAKNTEKNTITVTSRTSPPTKPPTKLRVAETPLSLTRRGGQGGEVINEVAIQNPNWILGEVPNTNKKYSCRIRYRQKKVGCKIVSQSQLKNNEKEDTIKIVFNEPQMGVASGQSLVLYQDEICLGGGIIK